LYDDKYSINPLNKLIILFLITYIYLALDPSLRINQLRFANGFVFSLQRYDIFFTIICFLAFLNCFNMFDGINGQSLIFAIIILFCIILKNPTFYLSVYFILILFGILILNLKNKVFLGDNGSYLLSFLLSVFLIKNYKFNSNINIEEIALILMFPFLDMIRVIFYRLMIGKHPFIADRNHLHHILLDILKSVKIVLIISTISIVMPILTYILFKDLGISMIFSIILYLAILLIFKNKRKNV
jgi:UDP-GlcNAc:undecaprenyl-phosphate/decaprenyl-phosphate GlcNAc-1-phosphate transferase